MKRFFLIALVSSILLIGCEKNEETTYLENGNYTGTFQRHGVWFIGDTANITMTFSSNTWTGSGDKIKYPALCNGTYRIEGDTIIFVNDCAWTTEFDWSLILSGKYKLIKNGNNIEFNKDYRSATADTYIDIYKLTKQ